jgi:hypothetical protein
VSPWRTDPEHRLRTVSPDVPILMYHSIQETPNRSIQGLSVHPRTFAEQLRYLRSEGFTGLTFGELCKRRRDGMPLPERPVVLTFDDGYADFVEKAVPLMIEHGFPATVFVTTGWLADAGPHAAGPPPVSRSVRTVTAIPNSTRSADCDCALSSPTRNTCWKTV